MDGIVLAGHLIVIDAVVRRYFPYDPFRFEGCEYTVGRHLVHFSFRIKMFQNVTYAQWRIRVNQDLQNSLPVGCLAQPSIFQRVRSLALFP